MPNHPKAFTNSSTGYKGYVYEHIYVATKLLGRELYDTEVVHHLDRNRSNNRASNLLVLDRGQHTKLHKWLDLVTILYPTSYSKELNICQMCGKTLQDKQNKYCSLQCARGAISKCPSKEVLLQDLKELKSLSKVGRKYNVSGNAVKKWMHSYNIQHP